MKKNYLDVEIKRIKNKIKAIGRNVNYLNKEIKFAEKVACCVWVPSPIRVDALRYAKNLNNVLDDLILKNNAEVIAFEILTKEKERGDVAPLFANIPINKDK